jgi:hypothetical protein
MPKPSCVNTRTAANLLALGLLALLPGAARCQTSIYTANGFEAPFYTVGPLVGDSPQQNWLTTDLNNFSTPAASIQTTTVFQGSQALRVSGPLLANDITFSFQTFWYHDPSSLGILPFNPVANGNPLVVVQWKQFLDGNFNQVGQIPFAGIFLEGLTASGTQQMITSVLMSNDARVRVITTGGNVVTSGTIPNVFNNWVDFHAEFSFATQRFNVNVNGVRMLTNVPFRNTFGATNRLVELGFQVSAIDLASPPPTNNVTYDDFVVFATIPEPSTLALFGVAVASVAYYRVRRRRAAALTASDADDDSENS